MTAVLAVPASASSAVPVSAAVLGSVLGAALVPASLVALTAVAALRAWSASARASLNRRTSESASPESVPAWFTVALGRLELAVPAERAWPAVRLVLGAVAVAGLVTVPGVLLAGSLVLVAGAWVVPRWRSRRVPVGYRHELGRAVDELRGALASGASLGQAVDRVGRGHGVVARDLATVAARRGSGQAIGEALDRWAASRPGTDAGLVVDALALAGASGGSQALALGGVGATLREREALGREVRALGAQARISAVVLTVAPIAFAAVVAALDRRIAHFLFGSPAGWACLASGCALDLTGAAWMARLVSRVQGIGR